MLTPELIVQAGSDIKNVVSMLFLTKNIDEAIDVATIITRITITVIGFELLKNL
jgi:hypothetical protein